MTVFYHTSESIPDPSIDHLGGKGAQIYTMVKLGMPVPPACIIPTSVCRQYMESPETVREWLRDVGVPQIIEALRGPNGEPPLLSVRSGAKFSMPGMMDTILNIGLTVTSRPYWREVLGDECVADCQQRLRDMYSDVVGQAPPSSLSSQLEGAILAVFESWNNERAKTYRNLHNIPHDLGTAVIVQTMVFGNRDDQSCTGVLFTRDPNTGEPLLTGEFLVKAQGEDVVAGTHTPKPLSELSGWSVEVATRLQALATKLETHYRDMQDIEFTVQCGDLFILQTRAAKRTAQAAIRVAVDMHDEGLIDAKTVTRRVTQKQFLSATSPQVSQAAPEPLARGIPASVGVATGIAVFSSKDAVEAKEPCILITEETTPDDIAGINAAKGILTSKGGMTSHAAVVARGMDRVCVVGCEVLQRTAHGYLVHNGPVATLIQKGDKVVLDGATGRVWVHAEVPVEDGFSRPEIQKFLTIIWKSVGGGYRAEISPSLVTPQGTWFVAGAEMCRSYGDFVEVLTRMDSGVIDLTRYAEMLPPSDKDMFQTMFPHLGASILLTALKKAVAKVGKTKDLSGIWIVAGPQNGLGKMRSMPVIYTLEELVLCQHSVAVCESVHSEAHAKVLEMRAALGQPLDLVFLGADASSGGKVVKSDLRLLQEILP